MAAAVGNSCSRWPFQNVWHAVSYVGVTWISTADVVARGAVAACRMELDRASEVMIYGDEPHGSDNQNLENERSKMRQRWEEESQKRATLAVLKNRASRTTHGN
jgi:hypothetical protein